MITDKTKLVGLLQIEVSNLDDYLDDIIGQKESELLERWFGYALAKDLQSATPSTEAQTLLDGFEYTDDDGDLQYIRPLSIVLPYFIYFYVVRDKQLTDSNVGTISELAENSQAANPLYKLTQNYNRGVELINLMIDYVNDNSTETYTDYVCNGFVDTINIFGI